MPLLLVMIFIYVSSLYAYRDDGGERVVDHGANHAGFAWDNDFQVTILGRMLIKRHRDLDGKLVLIFGVQQSHAFAVGFGCVGIGVGRGGVELRAGNNLDTVEVILQIFERRGGGLWA